MTQIYVILPSLNRTMLVGVGARLSVSLPSIFRIHVLLFVAYLLPTYNLFIHSFIYVNWPEPQASKDELIMIPILSNLRLILSHYNLYFLLHNLHYDGT